MSDRFKDKLRGEPTRSDKMKAPDVAFDAKDEVFDATRKELDVKRHMKQAGREAYGRPTNTVENKKKAQEIVTEARRKKGK